MKNKKFNLIWILFAVFIAFGVILAVFTLQSASAPESAKTKTAAQELKIWGIPPGSAGTGNAKITRAIFDDFVSLHPEIDVKVPQAFSQGLEEGEANFLKAQAGGLAPDVITSISNRRLRGFIDNGFLLPLNKLLDSSPDVKEKIDSRLLRDLSGGDGKIYAIPVGVQTIALYWRKDIFKANAEKLLAAGLSPTRAPATWDELKAYAKILSRKSDDKNRARYGLGIWTGFDAGYLWQTFVWQSGGRMVKKVKTNRGDAYFAAFNEPAGVRALEFYKELAEIRVSGERSVLFDRVSKLYAGLKNGEIAMVPAVADNNFLGMTGFDPSVIGIAPLPAINESTNTVSSLTYDCIAINALTKDNPEAQKAAWKYIRHYISDRAEKLRTDLRIAHGLAPFIPPKTLEKFGYETLTDLSSPDWVETQKTLYENTHPVPMVDGWESIQTRVLQGPIEAVAFTPNSDPQKLLAMAAQEADTVMSGVDPEKMRRYRKYAYWISALFILLMIWPIIFGIKILKSIVSAARTGGGSDSLRSGALYACLFMLPALLSIAVWKYYPLMRGALMAFYDYRIMGESRFVGLDNFIIVFTDANFYHGLLVTFYYVFLTLLFGFLLPIVTAIVLSEIPKGKVFFRVLFYLPAMTTGVIIMLMWQQNIFDPSADGLLNRIVMPLLHLSEPIGWLKDKRLAMLCVVIPSAWAGAGPGSLIYLAALKGVPDELYEAADVDGAGFFHKLWNITFPSLKAIVIINFVGAFIGAFHAAQNVLIMTEGGPDRATHLIGLEIYYKAFRFLKFGYATAIGWVLGAMLIGFTLYQLRILRDIKFGTAK